MSDPDPLLAAPGDRTSTAGPVTWPPTARVAASGGVAELRAEVEELRRSVTARLGEVERALADVARELAAVREPSDGEQLRGLERRVEQLTDEVAGVHVTVQDVVAGTEAALRRAIAQAREDTVVAGHSVAVEVGASTAHEVAELRRSLGEAFQRIHADLAATSARDLSALQAELRSQLVDLRTALSEGFNAETDARDVAMTRMAEGLRTQMKVTRESVESTVRHLRVSLGEEVGRRSADAYAAIREELGAEALSLESSLVEVQQAQQQALRAELVDALASVSELVVDLAHQQNRARAKGAATTVRQLDELHRATSNVMAAQAELRQLLMRLWG